MYVDGILFIVFCVPCEKVIYSFSLFINIAGNVCYVYF